MERPRKKIVVFGATGDIGSQLAGYLARHKHTVTAITRKGDMSGEKAQKIFHKTPVIVVQVDLWNKKEIQSITSQADRIVHCSGVLKNKIKPDPESVIDT